MSSSVLYFRTSGTVRKCTGYRLFAFVIHSPDIIGVGSVRQHAATCRYRIADSNWGYKADVENAVIQMGGTQAICEGLPYQIHA
jgi:hypothetical protein